MEIMKIAKGIRMNDIPNVIFRDVNITKFRKTESNDNALDIDIRVIIGSLIHGDNIRISEIDGVLIILLMMEILLKLLLEFFLLIKLLQKTPSYNSADFIALFHRNCLYRSCLHTF